MLAIVTTTTAFSNSSSPALQETNNILSIITGVMTLSKGFTLGDKYLPRYPEFITSLVVSGTYGKDPEFTVYQAMRDKQDVSVFATMTSTKCDNATWLDDLRRYILCVQCACVIQNFDLDRDFRRLLQLATRVEVSIRYPWNYNTLDSNESAFAAPWYQKVVGNILCNCKETKVSMHVSDKDLQVLKALSLLIRNRYLFQQFSEKIMTFDVPSTVRDVLESLNVYVNLNERQGVNNETEAYVPPTEGMISV